MEFLAFGLKTPSDCRQVMSNLGCCVQEVAVKMLQNPMEALSATSAQVEKVPMMKAAFGALGQLSGT